jgi:Peptidogalycan biosysnthesis/recognition
MSPGGRFKVQVVATFRELPPGYLAQLGYEQPELEHSAEFLRYLEDVDPGNRRYFLLWNAGQLIAISQAVLTSDHTLPLSRPSDMLTEMLPADRDRVREEFESLLYPSVVVRNLWDSLPLIPPGATLDEAELSELFAAIENYARDWGGRSVTYLNGSGPEGAFGALLKQRGYLSARYCALAEVYLADAGSFDGYLRRFSGGTRRGIVRERRRFAQSGLSVQRLDPDRFLRPAVQQEVANWRRYGDDPDPELIYRLRHCLFHRLGDRAMLMGVTDPRGDLVASGIQLAGRNVYHTFTFGADYARQDLGGCYAELTFYTAVERALRLKYSLLNLGYSAYQAKVFRGAKLRDMYAYVLAADTQGTEFAARILPRAAEAIRTDLARITLPRLNAGRET